MLYISFNIKLNGEALKNRYFASIKSIFILHLIDAKYRFLRAILLLAWFKYQNKIMNVTFIDIYPLTHFSNVKFD